MAEILTAVVDTATNEFQSLGHDLDGTHIRVDVPRNPDPLREKYSGDPLNPIAAKSGAEITATQDAAKSTEAGQAFDTLKVVQAVALSNLAARLGKAPGALTAADISAERTRIIAIYKAL